MNIFRKYTKILNCFREEMQGTEYRGNLSYSLTLRDRDVNILLLIICCPFLQENEENMNDAYCFFIASMQCEEGQINVVINLIRTGLMERMIHNKSTFIGAYGLC